MAIIGWATGEARRTRRRRRRRRRRRTAAEGCERRIVGGRIAEAKEEEGGGGGPGGEGFGVERCSEQEARGVCISLTSGSVRAGGVRAMEDAAASGRRAMRTAARLTSGSVVCEPETSRW
ncbi:hypothetical protein EX30DRAFT_73875 [Ascodesmis nigricans]|uniref:Uncharacterized protein n=1 Tax=Ascodesmis nigricans TaxID=341454 RepID=A0A4V3SID4_9PEZI|nr:hypothetical protein EX30DRAFT_73875 [Ascodesmis nigricans]